MTETFSKLKKKKSNGSLPNCGMKTSSKPSPDVKRKTLSSNHNTNRPISREGTSRENTRRNKSRSKSGAQKFNHINPNINFKVGVKKIGTLNHKTIEDTGTKENLELPKQGFNLPSIHKNKENSVKFDSSLAGFATRSLSKNESLKIKKGAIDGSKSKANIEVQNKVMPESQHNFKNQNSLINVPKKYQFRGKRLNIDSQSITSSKNTKITTESIQKHAFHTKSGPVQVNEALNGPTTTNTMRYG